MDEGLIQQVEELGLSNKEARVYVANLMIGPSGVQQIAEASGIKRVTTYVILESLVSLGLVSQLVKAKKTLFNAESPENLSRLLDKKEQSLRDQREQLQHILPQLVGLKKLPKDVPIVKFYEGIEGIQAINQTYFEEIKKEGIHETIGMSDLDELHKVFPEIKLQGANPSRVKAKVKSKFLYTSSQGPVMAKTDKENNRESRYLPKNEYHFTSDISIAGDYIVMISLSSQRPIGVVIKSTSIAEGIRQLFKLAWESAKKYN